MDYRNIFPGFVNKPINVDIHTPFSYTPVVCPLHFRLLHFCHKPLDLVISPAVIRPLLLGPF